MKVLLIGLPYFSAKLAKELSVFDPGNQYLAFNTYYSKKDLLRFFWHLRSADLVYSIKGTTGQSKVFDYIIRKQKPLIIQWAGTDVLDAQANGNLSYANYAQNFCEAPWLIEELQQKGIHAKQLSFTHFVRPVAPAPFPEKFTVFTYLGKNRGAFYGHDDLVTLSQQLPEVQFKVVGDQLMSDASNVENIGWVEDIYEVIKGAHAHIRWTQHDSLANTVLESMEQGRHVFWKHSMVGTAQCRDIEELATKIKDLQQAWKAGTLSYNDEGKSYIDQYHNSSTVLGQLIQTFKSAI